MRRLYSAAWWLALPLVLARLWWRGRRESGYRQHIGERLALLPRRANSAPLVWLHAVSVGETRAAQPLIDALLMQYPSHHLLLTHMTPTGRAAGAALYARHGSRLQQAYLPYDIPSMLTRFLTRYSPQLCLLMETEIWPNLMAVCAQRQLPVVLINARLSARSLKKAHRLGTLMTTAAQQLYRVGAQTQADAERIRSLGVRHVEITGSIKFDVTPEPHALVFGQRLRQQIGGRPVLLFASSREGEEAMMIDALAANNLPPSTLLIIVPRHPQRFDAVAALVTARGLSLQRRTSLADARVEADVLLGDSMGEMFGYCAASDVVAMGGSLLPLGGQNPIEACAVGKPVLFGPHTFNFDTVSEEAIVAGAALRVADIDAMLRDASMLLRDDALRLRMGASAARFAQQHRGATERTLAMLRPLIAIE